MENRGLQAVLKMLGIADAIERIIDDVKQYLIMQQSNHEAVLRLEKQVLELTKSLELSREKRNGKSNATEN